MKVVVLGGSGFIGSQVVGLLANRGHAVTVLDIARPVEPVEGVQYVIGDWHSRETLDDALTGAEVVYQFIWATVPTTSATSLSQGLQANVLPSLHLFQACVEHNVGRVIFSSSGGAVYGPTDILPIPESHPLNPISGYGLTKMIVEHYLDLVYKSQGLHYVIGRPGNAYGRGQRTDGVQGVIGRLLWCAEHQHPFTLYGDGAIVRDYIAVEDIATAFVSLLDVDDTPQVFNIGTEQGTSIRALIGKIEALTGKQIAIRQEAARWFDVPANVLDISRIRSLTGWQPQHTLDEDLRTLSGH